MESSAAFLEWFVLAGFNIYLLFVLIRWRGLFSPEGLCLSWVEVSVTADTVFLLYKQFFAPETLWSDQEFQMRLYPTVLQIIGLLSLAAGMYVSDRKATRVTSDLKGQYLIVLQRLGIGITCVGLAFYSVALAFLGGAFSYGNLDSYRTQALSQGGFWYAGADIALFGLALVAVCSAGRGLSRPLLILFIVLTPLLLTSNKGGLQQAVIYATFLAYAFRRSLLKRMFRPSILVIAILLFGITTGVKGFLLAGITNRMTWDGVYGNLERTVTVRYSDDGLYRGYAEMTNYLRDGERPYFNGRVAEYSLINWIPRFIWPNKTDHPFRAIGYMINRDHHVNPREVSGITLIGWANADYGMWSVISYLFIGGFFLGIFRRIVLAGGLDRRLIYYFFTLFAGVSAESGFLSSIYTLVLCSGIVLPVWVLVIRQKVPRVARLAMGLNAPLAGGSQRGQVPVAPGGTNH